LCNLRFDDTNPCKEEMEYVESIREDVRWLGFDWEDREYFASDYFEQLHAWAVQMIEAGQAFVCDLTPEQIRQYRGTLTEPGRNSPYRDRSVEENLDLFRRMRAGEFPDGTRTLRAKVDMAHPNLNMRDPVMYRILHAITIAPATGGASIRCTISPMASRIRSSGSPIRSALWSSKTTGLCTTGTSNAGHLSSAADRIRPAESDLHRDEQAKTAGTGPEEAGQRLGRPALPTICGLRRRGYTPEAIRSFCERIGVAKFNSTIDVTVLENSIRDHLNTTAPRVMAVLRPSGW
jgi:glutaminyl-tRNA synthetase